MHVRVSRTLSRLAGGKSDPSSWIHPVVRNTSSSSWLNVSQGWLRHRVPAKPNRNAFVFAAHKGLLTLLEFPEATTSTNLTLVDVTIPSSSACFGLKHMFEHSPAWSFFLDKVVGYDTIVINQMVHIANGRGFLRHELSKDVYNLNFATEFHATTATVHFVILHKFAKLTPTNVVHV
ncbi:hypothetical protein DYB26_001629 [Aphanomyces astaci]|uniref:Uncharacterized protein n=1 Tax=Aphanomyces astaci TaxID=112090 RepID=A0A3R6WST9_APHAT|nr:hypothetical protein DYB26_001629 [Aphanomyces astaci]